MDQRASHHAIIPIGRRSAEAVVMQARCELDQSCIGAIRKPSRRSLVSGACAHCLHGASSCLRQLVPSLRNSSRVCKRASPFLQSSMASGTNR